MGKTLGHCRLASKQAGDDMTLTRYVRIDRGNHKTAPRGRQPHFLAPGLAPDFVTQSRTKFPATVKRVEDVPHLLVSGHSNVKIGRDVRKGKLRGYWIYTLSLEERATCPTSCQHWQSCYGNNMPFAKRIDHRDPEFLPALANEIERLLEVRGRRGILIRLHALGDFYHQTYVAFWRRMLATHPNLAIFGYTARQPGVIGFIGNMIADLNEQFPDRCFLRFSNGRRPAMSTVSIVNEEDCPDDAFVCPEQTGKTKCCATCAACWSTSKNVAFLGH